MRRGSQGAMRVSGRRRPDGYVAATRDFNARRLKSPRLSLRGRDVGASHSVTARHHVEQDTRKHQRVVALNGRRQCDGIRVLARQRRGCTVVPAHRCVVGDRGLHVPRTSRACALPPCWNDRVHGEVLHAEPHAPKERIPDNAVSLMQVGSDALRRPARSGRIDDKPAVRIADELSRCCRESRIQDVAHHGRWWWLVRAGVHHERHVHRPAHRRIRNRPACAVLTRASPLATLVA